MSISDKPPYPIDAPLLSYRNIRRILLRQRTHHHLQAEAEGCLAVGMLDKYV